MTRRSLCKGVLEEHFKVPFKRTMVNGYVIDFYNKDLMIGLMYNSIRHYKYSPKFHKEYRKFATLQCRDKLRERACRTMGIVLYTITYDVECVVGMMKRKLDIPNDCCCRECLLYDCVWAEDIKMKTSTQNDYFDRFDRLFDDIHKIIANGWSSFPVDDFHVAVIVYQRILLECEADNNNIGGNGDVDSSNSVEKLRQIKLWVTGYVS